MFVFKDKIKANHKYKTMIMFTHCLFDSVTIMPVVLSNQVKFIANFNDIKQLGFKKIVCNHLFCLCLI